MGTGDCCFRMDWVGWILAGGVGPFVFAGKLSDLQMCRSDGSYG